jgi:7-carboxy-7-deazaguanine synthase
LSYAIKEIYATLQGEGFHTGRPAVFLRFAGCNLWSGLEDGRPDALCWFCDTDFVGTDGPGGGRFDRADQLVAAVEPAWMKQWGGVPQPFVVCTGGEPLLQLDEKLVDSLHEAGFEVAVETNGTRPAPESLDWICVSPKWRAPFVQRRGDELKVIYPQDELDPGRYLELEFDHFYLQPRDGPEVERHTELVRRYCEDHPRWRMSRQVHKILGLR